MTSPHERTLAAIADRVSAHAGLRPPAWVLAARVRERMRALGVVEERAYLGLLEPDEVAALVECLRVGATRFFRHQAHVAALRRVVVPALAAAPARAPRVRAWSAGCASGEEAYTLAMILAEGLPGWEVDVLGTDISEDALAVARAGLYAEEALAPVPAHLRARWFRPAAPGRVAVGPELAARVRFERKNLVDAFGGHKDVILCRNVLIYFDAEARAETARRLADALAPGGFLFVGYAETLRSVGGLEAIRCEDGLVYRRTETEPATVAETAAAPDPVPVADWAADTVTVTISGSHDAPQTIAADLRRAIARARRSVEVHLDEADFLDDSVAPVLRRAEAAAHAAGLAFTIAAERPGPRRFLARHGLDREKA
jgi:chemotaxis protein methyltransferase CheR